MLADFPRASTWWSSRGRVPRLAFVTLRLHSATRPAAPPGGWIAGQSETPAESTVTKS